MSSGSVMSSSASHQRLTRPWLIGTPITGGVIPYNGFGHKTGLTASGLLVIAVKTKGSSSVNRTAGVMTTGVPSSPCGAPTFAGPIITVMGVAAAPGSTGTGAGFGGVCAATYWDTPSISAKSSTNDSATGTDQIFLLLFTRSSWLILASVPTIPICVSNVSFRLPSGIRFTFGLKARQTAWSALYRIIYLCNLQVPLFRFLPPPGKPLVSNVPSPLLSPLPGGG